ncbi:FecR domain-containing protein [Comamonas terrigena]|uniref:FecR domain-containing protein n=1 Tax=Comamonas terrigena TaxID=32013 RepID=UPI002449FD0B|nr:FecR domain-containing protein [Comamonas terrigena]MDH1701274.1 FecR domain-containing protein [Comamonas terrigena]
MAGDAMDARILDEAADWLVLWHDQGMTEAECADFERWRARSPAHRQAWARAELLMGRLGDLPRDWAMPVLDRPVRHARPSRRQVVAKLAALLAVAPTAWLGWQWAGEQGWTADVRTATGEQRRLTLADGSQLLLDTHSAVDIVFDGHQRTVHLRKGAIAVDTAPDAKGLQRPFAVHTVLGRLRALGTRFTVRQEDVVVHLAVTEGAVEVTLHGEAVPRTVVPAGQQTVLTKQGVSSLAPVSVQRQSWVHGMLMADAMALSDVCAELSRYRSGILQCAPEVAGLRVSGAYPLTDTDRALAMLQATYPIQAHQRWRGHWVTLLAR